MEFSRHSLPPLITPGEVVTFYSHKGGTGRTMALSNLAVLLARRHNATVPTLMVDWDLEAPGLHHYFGLADEGPGVLEFFEACRVQLQRRPRRASGDDALLAQRVLDAVDWEQYVCRVDQSRPLFLMRAGRQDAGYADRVAALEWDSLFDACPALFRCFAERLARHFRYVLVDSRSGRTDSAGVCTTLLPTKLVLVFAPNRQNLEGLAALVERATTYRRSHEDEQRPLLVYPLPARIDMEDGAQRALWRRGDPARGVAGYQPLFERMLGDAYGLSHISLESYFDEVQLQQTRSMACGEPLAVSAEQGSDRFSVTRAFESFLDWFGGGHCPWQSRQEIPLLASVAQARAALEHGGGNGSARAVSLPLARDLNRLGELYWREGRAPQAVQCFEESLALHVRVLGEDHLDTLAGKSSLAAMLGRQGKLEEAQFLFECVAEARGRLQGGLHPDTLDARASLAAVLAQQGDYTAALALQDAVLDAYLLQLGGEHLLTVDCQAGRADILSQAGRLELARPLQEQVMLARTRILGAEHADTLRARQALALTVARLAQGEAPDGRTLLLDGPLLRLRRPGLEQALPPYLRAGLVADADAEQADSLGDMIVMVQTLIEREQLPHARDLADALRGALLRKGIAPKLRKRGLAVLKRMYRLQGDKDALVALHEDEVLVLEGALSEARAELP